MMNEDDLTRLESIAADLVSGYDEEFLEKLIVEIRNLIADNENYKNIVNELKNEAVKIK